MKSFVFAVCALLSLSGHTAESHDLSPEEIKAKVVKISTAQDRIMLRGSTVEDIDTLFSLYTDDFTYVHEVYGGVYTREELYNNSKRFLKTGKYQHTHNRYKILNIIPGLNAAAVQRLEVESGNIHLAVFEFEGDKVSKIIEYWK